ncbi:efflux transporter outer membrane subunit [Terriglobus saanensis]|uniref:RND efflux system, outer membrane lipoprotein, NodT family n=1 Tax=Terriglobus saanensis (strain ATCC BAA-1853 / DSM 23119 / SP1PR4) TaxID=401053 RepID=E8UYJ4_TERSS|nr:efflux transporter outer membrane subunit [Terriglobus saanensis]ADV83147.1 RND efflux system, outer membrane lipoprotein, NodT family [Terriglobus saanensis SP1PR4]
MSRTRRIKWTARKPGTALFLVTAIGIAGCKVGPNYKRPVVDMPANYRQAQAPDIAAASNDPASLGDHQWATIFQDPILQKLIQQALTDNLDLHIAAQRVLEAQAQLGMTRPQQFPSVSGSVGYSALQIPQSLAGNNSDGTPATSLYRGGGPSASTAWNLDFWGMYRRQSEAARADLLASEWGQRATRTTLVQSVADAYFQLRSLDAELEITQNTIKARTDSLKLTQALNQHGAGSLADVRQAEELLHAAQANLPELRRQIAVEENALSTLLGHNPGPIGRGLPIDQQPHPLEIPVGVPSQLLVRRPDIQQAEARLAAANARIGVARAQYFPQVSLTGMGGFGSNQLNAILNGSNAYWYAAGSISEPIFDAGRIRNNYHLSQAQQQEMLFTYRKSILNALQDVSNSLVSYRETRERRQEQFEQVKSAADAVRLARLRYAGGNTSYLEVLTTDTDLYSAQLLLAQSQQQEANSLVQLYAALGGGWQ